MLLRSESLVFVFFLTQDTRERRAFLSATLYVRPLQATLYTRLYLHTG